VRQDSNESKTRLTGVSRGNENRDNRPTVEYTLKQEGVD